MTVVTASKGRKEFIKMVASRQPFVMRDGKKFSIVMPIPSTSLASAARTLEDWADMLAGIRGLLEASREGTRSWDELKVELGL